MTTSKTTGHALAQALLYPQRVALLGASEDPTKTAGRPLTYLRRAGFKGTIYPVNARRQSVQGEKAYPTIASLPEAPDHVFIVSPTETVVEAVEQCARGGVKVVTILASGFGEAGPEGLSREAAILEIARHSGMRIMGPSSLGVVNPSTGLMLTANAAFAERDLPRGEVFVASHSGSMIGAIVSRGKARGIGFAGLVSVGGEIDLSIGEICAATLDDPNVNGYLLFLESLRNGPELARFAVEASRRQKPVVAYKLGRSAAAAEMAQTHMGAMAGEDDVADAFLRELGIARVGTLDGLLECLPLARQIRTVIRADHSRVGIVTTTGGGAAMVVDQLGVRGIEVRPPSTTLLGGLQSIGVPAHPGRVLDLTLAGTRYDVMKPALDAMLASGEFDLVLAVVGSSARFQPELAVRPIIEYRDQQTALAAMLVPDAPDALASLTARGIPCFRSPESCADSVAAVFGRRTVHARPVSTLDRSRPASPISEFDAYALLDKVGVPHAPAVLLALDQPPTKLPFGFPVAVKLSSREVTHKTDLGGVMLGVRDAQGLQDALSDLRRNIAERAPGLRVDAALVQPMVTGLCEVLLGYRVDPEVGPIVMLAAGGIWAEVMRDRSIRLAPVTLDTAREMVLEVRALQTVTGLRGRARGDLDALAHAICALSRLAELSTPKVREAEVNPLMILEAGSGVCAVDALFLLEGE